MPNMTNNLPYKREGRPAWYGYVGGVRKSLETEDYNLAKEKLRLAKEIHKERRLIRFNPSRMPLNLVIEDFNTRRASEVSKGTQSRDKLSLRYLTEYYGDKALLSAITYENLLDFRSWLVGKKFEPAGINATLRHVKGFFKYLQLTKILKENPCQFLKQLKTTRKRIEIITEEQRAKIINKAGTWVFKGKDKKDKNGNHIPGNSKMIVPGWQTLIAVMFYTGISRTDITNPIYVHDSHISYVRQKTGQTARPHISAGLRPYIAGFSGIVRLFKNNPRYFSLLFEYFMRDIGFSWITPHVVRKNFIIRYLQISNGDYLSCAEMVGHNDKGITILKNYQEYLPQIQQAVMDRF